MTHRRFACVSFLVAIPVAAAGCSSPADTSDVAQSEAALGGPSVLASNQIGLGDLVLDTSYAYWTTSGNDVADGAIVRVSKLGGKPVTLASHQSVPFGIAVDETQVYWANFAAGGADGALMAVAKTGGTPRALLESSDGPRSVVVDAARVYTLTSSAIVAVGKHGGVPTTVAATQCGNSIAADDTSLYWVVNCVMFPPQGIFKVAKAGGTPVKLSNLAPPRIQVQREGIYFVDGGNVVLLPKLGGAAIAVSKFDVEGSAPLALDALSFYAGVGTGIAARSRYGGAQRILAPTSSVGMLAVDSGYVYWTAEADGRVMKVSKY